MIVASYLKNVARSSAYALPAYIGNRIPKLSDLYKAVSSGDGRESIRQGSAAIGSIIQEDVFDLLKKGMDNTQSRLKSGKFIDDPNSDESMDNLSLMFGGDESAFSNDFLNDTGDGTEGSTVSGSNDVAKASAFGAATGVMATAKALTDSPVAQATAFSTNATANFTRAGVAAQIAGTSAITNALMGNSQLLRTIAEFQSGPQQQFIHKQIEHNLTMATLTSEIVNRLGDLKSIGAATAVASESITAAFMNNGESSFRKVFRDGSNFDVGAYMGVLATRTKNAIGEDSMFGMAMRAVVAQPMELVVETMFDKALPTLLKKQSEQFDRFLGNLPLLLSNRAGVTGRRLVDEGGFFGKGVGKFLQFMSVEPEAASAPNLSNIVRGQAVAFDGYAHRSLVEIIPSLLSDIHAEQVALRRGMNFADPTDRKLYDFKSGRFVSEAQTKVQEQNRIRNGVRDSTRDVRQLIGDGGNRENAAHIDKAIEAMVNNGFVVQRGNTENFASQLEAFAAMMDANGDKKSSDAVRKSSALFTDAHAKNGSSMSARLQTSLLRARAQQAEMMNAVSLSEGADRMIYSGQLYDAEMNRDNFHGLDIGRNGVTAPNAAGRVRGGKKGNRKQRRSIVQTSSPTDVLPKGLYDREADVYPVGDGTKLHTATDESVFRNKDGKVTIDSLLKSPGVILSKTLWKVEDGISRMFFGDMGEKKVGLFGKVKNFLIGEKDDAGRRNGGVLGGAINFMQENLVSPIRNALIGKKGDEDSKNASIVGTIKRWTKDMGTSVNEALFGKKTLDGEGNVMKREGGLFGRVTGFFSGKSKELKNYLLGKSDDGTETGVLLKLRNSFNDMVDRMNSALFGKLNEGGRRSGGAFGDSIQKGKDFIQGLWTTFQTKAVQPLSKTLFGVVDPESGRRAGGVFGNAIQKGKDITASLWSGFQKKAIEPLSNALFGVKDPVTGARSNGMLSGVMKKGGDLLNHIWTETSTKIFKPVSNALFGKGTAVDDGFGNIEYKDQGIFPTLFTNIKKNIISPIATTLFGEKQVTKDKDGNIVTKRSGGTFGMIWQSMKDAFAPLKESFIGENGILTNIKNGVMKTFSDMADSFFGKKGENGKRTSIFDMIGEKVTAGINAVGDFMQRALAPVNKAIERAGDWMREKVFEPFGRYLNDPETGLISRTRKGLTNLFYGKEDPESGERSGGIFGSVNKAIKSFFYGDESNGNKGFVQRVVEPMKELIKTEIWDPLKKNITEIWDGTKRFFKEEVFAPLKGTLEPFITEAKEQWRLMKEWVKGPLWDAMKGIGESFNQSVRGVFGKSLTDMLRDNILNPIKDVLSSVKEFLGTALKGILRIPTTVIKTVADDLATSQIKRGVYRGSREERDRLLGRAGLSEMDVPAGQGSSLDEKPSVVKKADKVDGSASLAGPTPQAISSVVQQPAGVQQAVQTVVVAPQAQAPAAAAQSSVIASGKAVVPPAQIGTNLAQPIEMPNSPIQAQAGIVGATPTALPVKADEKGTSSVAADTLKAKREFSMERAVTSIADNTHNLYQFAQKHLWGVGKNLERIVSHFKIKKTSIGKNSDEDRKMGIAMRLRQLFTNPIGFMTDLVDGLFKRGTEIIKKVTSGLFDMILLPFKMLNKVVGGLRDSFSNLIGLIKDGLVGAFKTAIDVTAYVAKTASSVISKTVGEISKALPAVFSAISSAATSIVKTAGSLIHQTAKILGSLTTSIVKMGAEMIRTAAVVAKNIVTGIAQSTFWAIKSVFTAFTGTKAKAKLTPVYVVGGYLAGTEGGASSWTTAAASNGTFFTKVKAVIKRVLGFDKGNLQNEMLAASLMGKVDPELLNRMLSGRFSMSDVFRKSEKELKTKFKLDKEGLKEAGTKATGIVKGIGEKAVNGFAAVKEKLDAGRREMMDIDWKSKMVAVGEKTATATTAMRKGLSSIGSMLMSAVPLIASAIGGVATFFTKGKFVSILASLLKGGSGIGDMKGSKGKGIIGRAGKGIAVGTGIAAAGGLAGMGLGAIADNMDDQESGTAKTLHAAASAAPVMAEYASYGAMAGSIIPGVGTAVGAGVGAGVGLAVNQWDNIKAGANRVAGWFSGNKPEEERGIVARATGGPLGKNGTLVGELGPELLDGKGNVISGLSGGSAAIAAAQEREDSISGMLRTIASNTAMIARIGASSNAALGGDPIRQSTALLFDAAKEKVGRTASGIFSVLSDAQGIGSSIGQAVGSIGSSIVAGGKAAASSIGSGVSGAYNNLKEGNFSGAASSFMDGMRGAGSAAKTAFKDSASAVGSAASEIKSVISKGDNLKMLTDFMSANGMTDQRERAMFLAQLDHESGGFRQLSENLNYSTDSMLKVFPKYFKSRDQAEAVKAKGKEAFADVVYGGRMGNDAPGDGYKYRGRGFIQLTGKSNYAAASKDLGLNLVENPDQAADPSVAAKLALWYWNKRGIGSKARAGDVAGVTRLINGGENGIGDRQSKFQKYMNSATTAVAGTGVGNAPVKAAMNGGFLNRVNPMLVGEQRPEVLDANGRIHQSFDSFMSNGGANLSKIINNTALKEAARRSMETTAPAAAPAAPVNSDMLNQILNASATSGDRVEELLSNIVDLLTGINDNTGGIKNLSGGTTENKSMTINKGGQSTNIFAGEQPSQRQTPTMSSPMRQLISGV